MSVSSDIRRICFFGGPGLGKSQTSALMFGYLKKLNYNAELVSEYIKSWAYDQRTPTGFDQVYIFAKQLRLEERVLKAGAQYIISDSPLFLSCFYAKQHEEKTNIKIHDNLLQLTKHFEELYPSLNIFINRNLFMSYQSVGRYHTLEQAVKIDKELKEYLNNHNVSFTEVKYEEENISKIILKGIKNEP